MFTAAAHRLEIPSRIDGSVDSATLLERARTIAAGLLGGGVVHEFANLLTVIDGLSQMSAHGISFEDCRRMIRPSAERSSALIDAYRHFFADRGSDTPVTFDAEMRRLEILLRIRLRGSKAKVDFADATAPFLIDGRRAPTIRVAWLVASLAHVDQLSRTGCEVGTLRCVPAGVADSAEWVLRTEPGGDNPARMHATRGSGDLLLLAASLVSQWGTTLRSTISSSGAIETRIPLRAALADAG